LSLWRKSRQENHRAFATAISNVLWVRVLQPFNPDDCCPFSAILLFDSPQRRDFVRERLIASRVYPAILWSLESPVVTGIPPHNLDFSRRMLSIHCDGRYSKEDMLRVAELVIKIGNEFRNW
ncbi:MAG: hypothetical protein ACUVUR_06495, partial [bacterium]